MVGWQVRCAQCQQVMVARPDSMVWECPDCAWRITDLERRMAAGPIPRHTLTDLDLSRFGFGYGWTANPGIRFPEATSSPSPTGTDECHPAQPQQDQAELRRIRAEAVARQTEAESRARALLVEVIGEPAVQTLEAGGTYAVPSVRWPGTEYHIPKQGYIKIVKGGMWQEVCLVSSDHSLPWADIVFSRIKMIEANETIVQGRGNRQGGSPNRTLDALREAVQKFITPQRRR